MDLYNITLKEYNKMAINALIVDREKTKIINGQAWITIKDARGFYVGTFNIVNQNIVKNLEKMIKDKKQITMDLNLPKPWKEELIISRKNLNNNG